MHEHSAFAPFFGEVRFEVQFPSSISEESAAEVGPVLRGMGLGPLPDRVPVPRLAKRRRARSEL